MTSGLTIGGGFTADNDAPCITATEKTTLSSACNGRRLMPGDVAYIILTEPTTRPTGVWPQTSSPAITTRGKDDSQGGVRDERVFISF